MGDERPTWKFNGLIHVVFSIASSSVHHVRDGGLGVNQKGEPSRIYFSPKFKLGEARYVKNVAIFLRGHVQIMSDQFSEF